MTEQDVHDFLHKLWITIINIAPVIFVYLFPSNIYVNAAIAVIISVLAAHITEIMAISKENGGYINAVRSKIIKNEKLTDKTIRKLVCYFILIIIANTSIRVFPIQQAELQQPIILTTYAVLYIIEWQEILQNVIRCGANGAKPLLSWVKKIKQKVFKTIDNTTSSIDTTGKI